MEGAMEGPLLKQLGELSKCPVCADALRNPHILPCGHTFCRQCLEEISKSSTQLLRGQTLKCPLCNARWEMPRKGVTTLPTNFTVKQMYSAVEDAYEMKPPACCEACKLATTELILCFTCEDFLCHKCGDKHANVFPLHKLEENKATVQQSGRCGAHPRKMLSCYCTVCQKPVCPLCATSDHSTQNHRVVSAEEARKEHETKVGAMLATLRQSRSRVLGARKETQEKIQATESHLVTQKKMVDASAKRLIERIEIHRSRLQSKLEQHHGCNMNLLKTRWQELEGRLCSVDEALDIGAQMMIIVETCLFPSCQENWRETFFQEDSSPDTDSSAVELVDYYFTENLIEERLLGELTQSDVASEEAVGADNSTSETDEIVLRRKGRSRAFPMDQCCSKSEETVKKTIDYFLGKAILVSSYLVESGVVGIPVKPMGIGLAPNNETVVAYNTNSTGQIVLCTKTGKHQVLYHVRKGISAFAMYREDECAVVHEDDCRLSRCFLGHLPADREAQCLTQRVTAKASNISGLCYSAQGQIVLADKDRRCVYRLHDNKHSSFQFDSNDDKFFSNDPSFVCGPKGEIILLEKESHRLAVFSSITKRFVYHIQLPGVGSKCQLACDDFGMLYVSDTNNSRVVRVPLSPDGEMQKILDSSHGLVSPSFICVREGSIAVIDTKSISEAEIRLYDFHNSYLH